MGMLIKFPLGNSHQDRNLVQDFCSMQRTPIQFGCDERDWIVGGWIDGYVGALVGGCG